MKSNRYQMYQMLMENFLKSQDQLYLQGCYEILVDLLHYSEQI